LCFDVPQFDFPNISAFIEHPMAPNIRNIQVKAEKFIFGRCLCFACGSAAQNLAYAA
jgi:hypothetical protein